MMPRVIYTISLPAKISACSLLD